MSHRSDRINKIDRIEENIRNPHIGTNLHKSICGDECGFLDCNLAEQIEKDLHVSTSSTRLENSLRSSAALRLCVEFFKYITVWENSNTLYKVHLSTY